MCGRTSVTVKPAEISDRFGVRLTRMAEEYVPKYNVDPSDGLLTVTNEDTETADVREWGFIPAWADDPDEVPNPINARAETVRESGMYHDAFKQNRCLVVADGFYEWQGARGRKQPYRVCREDRGLFAFAGIYSGWMANGSSRETVSILTTEPNDVVAEIHDRMPVMLERGEEFPWLNGSVDDAVDVLDPYPASELEVYPVSTQVNNPEHDSPALLDRIDVGEQSGLDDFAA